MTDTTAKFDDAPTNCRASSNSDQTGDPQTTDRLWGWNGDMCAVWGVAIVLGDSREEKEARARLIAATIVKTQTIAEQARVARCPSTHCERRGECCSPHECIVKPKAPELKVIS